MVNIYYEANNVKKMSNEDLVFRILTCENIMSKFRDIISEDQKNIYNLLSDELELRFDTEDIDDDEYDSLERQWEIKENEKLKKQSG